MTAASETDSPDRFRFLATYIAGRSVEVTEAPAGQPAHTNGQFIFVSAGGSVEEQRREMLVQAALLGAGSLDPRLVKAIAGTFDDGAPLPGTRRSAGSCRTRPTDSTRMPRSCLTDNRAPRPPMSHSRWPRAEPRLPTHRSGSASSNPPGCWRRSPDRADRPPTKTSNCSSTPSTCPNRRTTTKTTTMTAGSPGRARSSSCFESPLFNNQSMSDYFRKMFGGSRSPGEGAAGAEMTGSLHPAGAGDRTECPSPAHPDPLHR